MDINIPAIRDIRSLQRLHARSHTTDAGIMLAVNHSNIPLKYNIFAHTLQNTLMVQRDIQELERCAKYESLGTLSAKLRERNVQLEPFSCLLVEHLFLLGENDGKQWAPFILSLSMSYEPFRENLEHAKILEKKLQKYT